MLYLQQITQEFSVDYSNSHYFCVFYLGSLLGYLFKRWEDFELSSIVQKRKWLCNLFGFLCFSLLVIGIRLPYTYGIKDYFRFGNYWCIFLGILVFCAPNIFTEWFSTGILRQFGKISFGAYLFHHMCFRLVTKYDFWGLFKSTNANDRLLLTICYMFLFGTVFHHTIEIRMIQLSKYCIKTIQPYVIFPDLYFIFGRLTSRFANKCVIQQDEKVIDILA